MPMRSTSQRAYLHAVHPEIAKRFEDHTPPGAKLPRHVRDNAREKGASAACALVGLDKSAGIGGMIGNGIGKAMQFGGKALGFLPTGVGNAAGAALGGVGGAISGAATAPPGQRLRGAGIGAVSGAVGGALPMGAGMVADPLVNAGLNRALPGGR